VQATLSTGVQEEPSGTQVKRYKVPSSDAGMSALQQRPIALLLPPHTGCCMDGSVDLASIFELLNAKAAELGIVDFSVTQTTLEDVFLGFARLQP
jgi:hypothetical protein